MRKADTRTKRQILMDAIYDPVSGKIFGHTKKRWGEWLIGGLVSKFLADASLLPPNFFFPSNKLTFY
jgi:hypothetical protein